MGLEIYDETPDMSLNLLNAWQDMIILDEDEENDMIIIDSDASDYESEEIEEWLDEEEQLGGASPAFGTPIQKPIHLPRELVSLKSVTSPNPFPSTNPRLSNTGSREEIMSQLEKFGYAQNDIQHAMDLVVNDNINDIVAKLQENEHHNTTIESILNHVSFNDEAQEPITPQIKPNLCNSPSIDVDQTLSHLNGNAHRYREKSVATKRISFTHDVVLHEPSMTSRSEDDGTGDIFTKPQPFSNESLAEMKEEQLRHSTHISATAEPAEISISDMTSTVEATVTSLEEMQQNRLQRLAQKRVFIEEEIVMTEKAYRKEMNVLVNEFLRPIYQKKMVDKQYEEQLLTSLDTINDIVQFHSNLLNQIDISRSNGKTVAWALNAFIKENKNKFIALYLEWIEHYDATLDLFGKTLNNKTLTAFLKTKRREKKPLSGFLILPVQRVPRASDYKVIEEALELIHSITEEINTRKKLIENKSQCLQIQEALHGLTHAIVGDGDRQFLHEYIFIKKGIKHQRLFFLFSDILIIANEKWRVKQEMSIKLLEVKIVEKEITEDDDEELSAATTPKTPVPTYSYNARRSIVMTSNVRKSIKDLTIDASKNMKHDHRNVNEEDFPEFQLFHPDFEYTTYIAKDLESIVEFRNAVREHRHNALREHVKTRHRSTIGSFSDALDQQALVQNSSK